MPGIASLLVRIDATTEQLRRELASADKSLTTFSSNTDRKLSSIDSRFSRLGAGIKGIQGLLGGLGVAMGGMEVGRAFTQMADAATTMENRLRSVTGSEQELVKAQQLLYESAQENSVEMSSSVELFARMSRALQGTGADAERVAEMVDTLSKTVRLSGATSHEASAALQQLSQALQGGRLNGEEFVSISQQLPELLKAIAEEVSRMNGISLEQARAELKKMSEDGKLTTEVVSNAIENMRDGIVEAYSEIQDTAANATTKMWNALTRLVGKIDDVTGISGGLVEKIDAVSGAFDSGVDILNRYGGALQTLLGWINAIPHPLSLIGQAAMGVSAQVAQAANEINAIMKSAEAVRAQMGAGVQAWQEQQRNEARWQGNITRGWNQETGQIGNIEALRNKLAGGLKVLEATGGRPVSPVLTNPMDVAAISGDKVDFTTFGVGPGNVVTGVTRDRPKLEFYQAPSKEEQKAAEALQKDADRLRESTRTAQEEFQARVADYKMLLDKKLIDPETYGRAFAQAGQKMSSALMQEAREGAKPASRGSRGGGGGRRSGGGGRGSAEKSLEREGESVFRETRTAAEEYAAEIARLDELLARNAITNETYARAVESAGEALRSSNAETEQARAAYEGGQTAAQAYLDEISRLDSMLQSGAINQDEHSKRVLDAQQKYGEAKGSAAGYAEEVAKLDAALAAGAISEQEHAASLEVARDASNEALQESARLWEETRTPIESYYEELRKIEELWASGAIGDDTKLRAVRQAWEELGDATEETNASMKAAKILGDDLGMSFASSFEDAIIEGGKLRDIMKGLWEDIQRIVVRQMVTVPLATGLSSIISGMTGAMMGGGVTPLPSRTFQHGGLVKGGGSGTSDSIPVIMPGGGLARLSNGEFIVNARAASKHEDLLMAINSNRFTREFSSGGLIGNLTGQSYGHDGGIQITLENKSGTNLKMDGAKQRRGPDGRTMIRVMVTDAVKEAMGAGEFDRTMGARYGAAVQPIVR